MQQALKTAQSQPRGEIKPAGGTAQEKYLKAFNDLPEIERQAITNPVFNATAAGGLVTVAAAATPVLISTASTTANTTALLATDIITKSTAYTFMAGAAEGIIKGVTSTPPDVTIPYLNSTPL